MHVFIHVRCVCILKYVFIDAFVGVSQVYVFMYVHI